MFKLFNKNQQSTSDNSYSIYQIKSGNEFRDIRFTPYEQLQHLDKTVNSANYELIYTAPLTNDMSLDKLFEELNTNLPADFKGHSLSVSDVVVLKQNEQSTAHYVDSIGFVDVPKFLQSLSLNEQSAKALAAVTQNGLALKHINEQNPEICLAAITEQTGISKRQPNFITKYDVLEGVRAHDARMINALISPNKDIQPHKGVSFDGIHFTSEYCWSAVHFPQWVKLVDSVGDHSFRYICDEEGNFLNWSGNVAEQRSDIPRCQMEEADAMEL
ncbi:MAG: YodL domain-containing protein [Christensenella sp.]